MRGQFTFTQIPGTIGTVQENGWELIISGDNLDQVKSHLTVDDKTEIYRYQRLRKSLSSTEKKLFNAQQISDEHEISRLEAKIDETKLDMADAKSKIKREYWYEREDGSLSVPAGFWGICETIVGDAHLNTEVKMLSLPEVEGKTPRYYQIEGVDEALKYKRASIVVPTGAGKTLMITNLAYSFVKAGKRVCVIEPTVELVSQTKKALEKYLDNISGLGGKFKFKLGNDILVTTINSAKKYIDLYDCVIIDEMQHSAAESYVATGYLAIKAKYYYGLTACPIRADGLTLGIHGSCGPVVYMKDTKWGIENGFLSGAKVCMVEVKGTQRFPDSANAAIVYNNHMHSKKVCEVVYELLTKSLNENKKVLILYKTVQAGEAFKSFCSKQGITFDVANSEYRLPLEQFREGKIDFLVANSGLMAEGVDVPNIDCVITCVQNSSENLTRQIMGRGLRLAKEKKHLILFDVFTVTFPQYQSAAKARLKIYKTTGCETRVIIR